MIENNTKKYKYLSEFWLIVLSTFLLFINSSYSPIKDLSYLNYDSTLLYIIGKGIKYGFVPYKDLIDHKGVYIFLVNYLGALLSEYKHIGIFIVQLIISYFNIIVVYRIASLFTSNRKVSFLSALSVFILQNTYYFCYGAMKCEGLLSPFIYLTVYLFLKHLLSCKSDQSNKEYSKKDIFISGMCAGIVLFTKVNLLIYFAPIIIVLIIKSINKPIAILKYFLYGALGLIAGSAPAIIYCLYNNCLREMIYYSFNINYLYSSALYFKYNTIIEAIYGTFYEFKEIIVLSLASIVIVYNAKNEILFYYILFVASSILTVFVALRPYSYYANTLAINTLPIFIFIYSLIFDRFFSKIVDHKKMFTSIAKIVILILMTIMSYNMSWLTTKASNYREYIVTKHMASLVKDEERHGNDKSTLVVGAAIQIYNELNSFPNVRFFGTPYIAKELYSEPYEEILESIKKRENAWIVLSFTPYMIKSGFSDEVRSALKDHYRLVGDETYAAEIYHRIGADN